MNKINKIRLFLTRHGETEENVSKTICGQKPGTLTGRGVEQAKMLGKWLNHHKTNFHHIYVSDLQRTKDTFKNMLQEANYLSKIKTQQTPVIREKSGGVLQGKPRIMWKQEAQKANIDYRQYKCQNSQSLKDVYTRALHFLQNLIQRHLLNQNQPNISQIDDSNVNILAVTHGGFIRQFNNVLEDITKKQNTHYQTLKTAQNCSISEYLIQYQTEIQNFNKEYVKIQCVAQNLTQHLKQN